MSEWLLPHQMLSYVGPPDLPPRFFFFFFFFVLSCLKVLWEKPLPTLLGFLYKEITENDKNW